MAKKLKTEVPWKIYKEKLPLANKIYLSLFNKPTTNIEIANKYNKVGEIIRILESYE